MDSFEFNKIAGAFLMTLLIVTVIGHVGDIIIPKPEEGGKPSIYFASGQAASQPAGSATAEKQPQPFAAFLAKANAEQGARIAKTCETCHNVQKGKGPKIGPDLWGVVGRKVASADGFQYSDAIKKLGGEWSFDKLNEWLESPQKMAPGTKMTFAGVKDEQQRADVVAFLNSQSDKPLPLPKAPAEPAKAAAAPAPAAGAPAGAGAKPAAPAGGAGSGIDQLLASANAEQGAKDARVCEVCHNFEKGKGPKIGPDLWGVVGRKVASQPNFSYSDAIKKLGGEWTFDKLDEWLSGPQKVAPGTKMVFAGVPDAKKRADIIAFLNTKSDSPKPLPKK
jgi:cytochrome c